MADVLGDWAARARDGDREAARLLAEALHREVRWAAAHFAAGPEEAEDLAQDAWEHVLANLGPYDPKTGPFRPWLYTVLRNLWISRKRKRRPGAWPEKFEPFGGGSPSAEAAERELLRLAERAIRDLPARDVRVLFLYLNGRPYDEIAAEVGVGRENARKIVERTLAVLRRILCREGDHDAR